MNPIFALLTFRAFRPDYRDVEETMAARFRLRKFLGMKFGVQRLLVVSAGRVHWRAAMATFDASGAATLSDTSMSPATVHREALIEWLRDFAQDLKLQYVAVGVGHGFSVASLSAVTRLSDVETMKCLRTEPARLLGDGHLAEEINCLVHHPGVEDSSLRFKIRAAEVTQIRDVCAEAGFQVVRITCEQAQLIGMAYCAGRKALDACRALLVALPSSYVLLHLDAGGWHSPNFDPARDENTLKQIEAAITEALTLGGGGSLVVVNAGMAGLPELLKGLTSIPTSPLLDKTDELSLQSTLFQ